MASKDNFATLLTSTRVGLCRSLNVPDNIPKPNKFCLNQYCSKRKNDQLAEAI